MTQTHIKLVSEAETFKRENRYIVIKISDLVDATGLPMQPSIEAYTRMAEEIREATGKPPLECVVVEHDWPEYETVWQMIEARMTNRVSGEVDENTAKRFRGILSMLGIGAPESDEALMLCQFSLLGMVRHKIKQIFKSTSLASAPEVGEAVAYYQAEIDVAITKSQMEGLKQKFKNDASTISKLSAYHELFLSPQPDRTAQLEDKVKRLEAVANEYNDWIIYHDSGNGDFVAFLKERGVL